MTRTAIHKLLIVSGLTTLLTFIAIMPAIYALPLDTPPHHAAPLALQMQVITATITPTGTLPLSTTTPSPAIAVTHTATPSPTAASPIHSPTVTLTASTPTTTPKPTTTSTPSSTPTLVPTPTPEPMPTFTPTPTLTPTATSGAGILTTVGKYWPAALLVCLVGPLLILIVTLLWGWKRGRERPGKQPPPSPPPPPSPLAVPYLESTTTGGAPRRFNLKPGGMTVGRAAENDLVITPDFPEWETVSKHHARIYRREDVWIVEDLGSSNGVYVNGRRTGRNLLRDGWQVDIGGVRFTFRETSHSREA